MWIVNMDFAFLINDRIERKILRMKRLFTLFLVLIASSCFAQTKIGENIDVSHYEIRINEFNFTAHTIDAVTTVTLTAKSTLPSFALELKSLEVSSVVSSDAMVSGFNKNGEVLTITLASPLAEGASASFVISYSGNTFNDGWGGVLWNSSGYVCNMGVGFESIPHNLGKTWFPCVDDFVDKATYDVYLTVPNGKTSACGGVLEGSVDNGDGTFTDHWVVSQEIPTYLISFVVGEYQIWEETYHGVERDIPVQVFAKPAQYSKVPGTFVNVKEIAAYFEQCFGPYPFNRIGYSSTQVGCMEHVDNIGFATSLITGNTSGESYVAHEMAHMWFGNKVTCSTAGDMWLNEGFAQFCGMNYQAAIYGEEKYQEDMDKLIEDITKSCHLSEGWIPLNNMPLDLTYGTTVYDKGATVVHTLRNYLGPELFNETMRYYLDKFAFQSVSSEDLRDAITEYTGIDMTGFFDSWVFTCGAPHYLVDSVKTTPNGNKFDVDVFTSQKHRHSDHVGMGVILELAFMDEDWNIVTDTIHWDGMTGHTMKTINFEPIAVFCDYYNKYADARTDRTFEINTTGKKNATMMSADVKQITGTSLVRVEHHWVGPDHSLNPYSGELSYSEDRYWTVFRDDKGTAQINGIFEFTNTVDNLAQSENDSTILLYREDPSQPWRSIDYSFQGTWRFGKFTVEELLSGDYTLACIDKTYDSSSEITPVDDIRIVPNPAYDFINVSFGQKDVNRYSQIVLTDVSGRDHGRFSVMQNQVRIPVENCPSGVYFVSVIDSNNNVVASEKIIID